MPVLLYANNSFLIANCAGGGAKRSKPQRTGLWGLGARVSIRAVVKPRVATAATFSAIITSFLGLVAMPAGLFATTSVPYVWESRPRSTPTPTPMVSLSDGASECAHSVDVSGLSRFSYTISVPRLVQEHVNTPEMTFPGVATLVIL